MNKKFLSVVIPYYTEKQEDIFPLLSSIQNQIGIDHSLVEVLLVNDGNNNRFPDSFFSVFSTLEIKRLFMKENRGPGVARQYGLDRADGEYVMFCDADDVIHNVGVFSAIFQELVANQPDILASPWLEELWDDNAGQFIYITHEDEATWMHGKVFKTSYLKSYDIRFHDELRVHEDSYFLSIAFELTQNKRKILAATYVWKWRAGSITRQNSGAYTYESVPTFNFAVAEGFRALEQRGKSGVLPYRVIQMVLYTYFTLHQEHWQDNESYLAAAEESFLACFKPFRDYFYSADEAFVGQVYNQERAKHFGQGVERETLDAWLERVGY